MRTESNLCNALKVSPNYTKVFVVGYYSGMPDELGFWDAWEFAILNIVVRELFEVCKLLAKIFSLVGKECYCVLTYS